MRVLFRLDVSNQIGAGHLARCLVLAETLQKEGSEITFACQSLPGNDLDHLAKKWRLIVLPPCDADEAGKREQEDFLALSTRLGDEHFDWLIVDHYSLGAHWQQQMRYFVSRIAVIDDLNDREHDCDLLLDQNLSALSGTRSRQLPIHCRSYLGPRYALLRPCFSESRQVLRDKVERVLVNFGSNDLSGMTLKAVRALRSFSGLQVDVVAGKNNPDQAEILACSASQHQWRVHTYVEHIDALMRDADLAIGAGGVSMWERTALKLPSICIAVAANQCLGAEALARFGGHLYLGSADKIGERELADAVRMLVEQNALRSSLAERAFSLVDGMGGSRIAAALWGGHLRLRRAEMQDAGNLFAWRNDPATRNNSRNSAALSWQDHQGWMQKTLANPASILLVVETARHPVGVLRYDLKESDPALAEISIYLVPTRKGQGWGKELIAAGDQWIAAFWPKLRRIDASVQPDNTASLRLFQESGYQQQACIFVRDLKVESNA